VIQRWLCERTRTRGSVRHKQAEGVCAVILKIDESHYMAERKKGTRCYDLKKVRVLLKESSK
jgi:hypothetical protein